MGVREAVNKRPMIAGGVVVVLAAAAIAFAVMQIVGTGPAPDTSADPERAFFTVDDGQTWFIGDATQLAPFQHEGKEAVRAYVIECGGKRAVNHLERYTDEGKQAMLRLREITKTRPPPGQLVAAAQQHGREVKRPGDTKWIPSNTPGGEAVITPKCPPGTSGEATFVFP